MNNINPQDIEVALAIALKANRVEFYKDVPGIFSADPKKNPNAHLIPALTYEKMLEILEEGAEVLQARSVNLAKKNEIPLHVISFHDFDPNKFSGTIIGHLDAIRPEPSYEEEEI